MSSDEFRIVVTNGRRNNERLRALNVGGGMPLENVGSCPRERFGLGIDIGVGAGNPMSSRQQNVPQSAHADAPGANDVNMSGFV